MARLPDGTVIRFEPDEKGTKINIVTSELVTCKNCKYAADDMYTHCRYVAWYTGEDDFCSKGVRRDD